MCIVLDMKNLYSNFYCILLILVVVVCLHLLQLFASIICVVLPGKNALSLLEAIPMEEGLAKKNK